MIWRDETTIRSRIDAKITVFLGSNLRPTKEFPEFMTNGDNLRWMKPGISLLSWKGGERRGGARDSSLENLKVIILGVSHGDAPVAVEGNAA